MKPRIAVPLGDPSGIGPELVAKLLAHDAASQAGEILLIGDPDVLRAGQATAGVETTFAIAGEDGAPAPEEGVPRLIPCVAGDARAFPVGEASALSGGYVLETLREAMRLARQGRIEGICFAPLNKQAMHMAGSPFNDELHWFAQELQYEGYICELNTFDRLWTSRVTSHVALSEVSAMISTERVVEAVEMAHRTLRMAGVDRPRIAVAALNPHGGEGGLFGREEIEVIVPAVEMAREKRIAAEGPFPSDTVFIKARDGEYDAVVTMFHDQGQIAMKLMGFERGVTVQGGLPIPITTPAHGTAFDIVGQGKADPGALVQAFLLACRMGEHNRGGQPGPVV